MPLGQLPSWLNTSPEMYLHAITSGSQAGLELAKISQEADNAAAARNLAQERLAQEENLANARLAELKSSGDETRDLMRERIAAMTDLGHERNARLLDQGGQGLDLRQAALELARQRAGETADYRNTRAGQFQQGLDIAENNAENMAQHRSWLETNPNVKDASYVTLRRKGLPGQPDIVVRGNLKDPIDRASLRAAYGTNAIPSILQDSTYPDYVSPDGSVKNHTSAVILPVKAGNKAAANIFNYNSDLGTLEPVNPDDTESD